MNECPTCGSKSPNVALGLGPCEDPYHDGIALPVGGSARQTCPLCASNSRDVRLALNPDGAECSSTWHTAQRSDYAGGTIERWGDSQQYHAEPHDNYAGETKGVQPSVTLLWMTPDPLGAVAAMCAMYEGRVVRSLEEVTDEDRRRYWEQVQQTHLKAPLEAIELHFMVEGVDRAIANQMVRQRTAVFAQESLRFAVPGELHEATSLPPSLVGTLHKDTEGDGYLDSQEQRWRRQWDRALEAVDQAYHYLVNTGMPAEEARGLLPLATATRLNFKTNLRNLSDHAGNRLCTQAQFPWRQVFAGIVESIREYSVSGQDHQVPRTDWQFRTLGMSPLFRPVCYQLGKCPFKADFDRACTIRERVDQFSKHGVDSSHWDVPVTVPVMTQDEGNRGDEITIPSIQMSEWLLNPGAARA